MGGKSSQITANRRAGIYLSLDEDYIDRVNLAIELGIDWNNTAEWVPADKINIMLEYVQEYHHTITKRIEANTDTIFTPAQYDAIFSLIYWKPFLDDTIIYLIDNNASREMWIKSIEKALIDYYGEDDFAKYSGWTERIEKGVDLYLYGTY